MRSIYAIILVLVSYSFYNAQSSKFGVKAGFNFFNAPKINAQNSFEDAALSLKDEKTGYHIGAFSQLYFVGIYVRPELYYSQFQSDFEGQVNFEQKQKRLDFPLLFGKYFGEIAFAHTGIVASYYIQNEISYPTLNSDQIKDLQWGFQFGGGVELGKISLEARYERSFGSNITKFVVQNYNYEVKSNPNQFLLSLGYEF